MLRLFNPDNQYSVLAKNRLADHEFKYEICVIANGNIPTFQLSILEPLVNQAGQQKANVHLITESAIKKRGGVGSWFAAYLKVNNVTHVIFCRYSGMYYQELLSHCSLNRVPTLYCIDDDLLNVPRELGEDKYLFHNSPARLESVKSLLNQVDLVYCSNSRLRDKLHENGVSRQIEILRVFSAGKVLKEPELRLPAKIGYMGYDHEHDLKLVLPALVLLLQKHRHLSFELFGKISKPPELDQFGDRVRCIPCESNYSDFMSRLVGLQWDIGICPLVNTAFNNVKNNNKWVEYTSAGIAVVASKSNVYDECFRGNCGVWANQDKWFESLESLICCKTKRYTLVSKAQKKLMKEYTHSEQREQLCFLLDLCVHKCSLINSKPV